MQPTILQVLIVAKPVAPTIQLEFAPKWQPLELPTKSQPWTPIRSFLLERELSSYPDKAFSDSLLMTCSLDAVLVTVEPNLPIWQTIYLCSSPA